MGLEEQTLRFYLRVFSFLLLFLIFLFYIFLIKEIKLKDEFFLIEKNQSYKDIIYKNLNTQIIDSIFYKFLLKVIMINNIKIHYGKFEVANENNFVDLIKIITSPSNYFEKITIIEGWSKYDLNNLVKDHFSDLEDLEYNEVLANTYYFNYGTSFKDLKYKMKESLKLIKKKYKDNKLLEKYSFNEILIIGSLLEREGLDYLDKKKIYSVIINRLNKGMKLQIDATVIYSLTDGRRKLDRKLNYGDLKIEHKFNTYHVNGLPPQPISYVGLKTIELIFENYKSKYLFYFYNSLQNKHVYSINYNEHLKKLNEYRSKK